MIGAGVKQQSDHSGVAALSRLVQRRAAATSTGVRVGTIREQQCDQLRSPEERRVVERCASSLFESTRATNVSQFMQLSL